MTHHEHTATTTVDDYQAALPTASLAKFKELRAMARQVLPEANEVISYGIPAYKVGDTRAKVFISGWHDHVAIYPVPQDAALQEALTPYIKGKGTLWFDLDAPLPTGLIIKTMTALKEQ